MQKERQAAAAARDMPRNAKLIAQTPDVRIVEYTLAPGDAHPWHYHSEVSDRFYCLEGVIGVDIRTPPERHLLSPGECHEVPPGTVHHVSNGSDSTSRYLLVQALGQYDYIRAD